MLTLSEHLPLAQLIAATNIATLMDSNDASMLGRQVHAGYLTDKSTREGWESQMAEALKLALQVSEPKTEPWAGAANVKFPLITIAALSYHARVYPLLVPGVNVAKCRVIGQTTAAKTRRASRVAAHMSWQLLEQDVSWEEDHDKALLIEGIMGTVFKKSYFDPSVRYVTSRCVNPFDLVVDYFAAGDVNMIARATHRYNLSQNDIHERVVSGYYCDFEVRANAAAEGNQMEAVADARQGLTAPAPDEASNPIIMLEQLCWFDLDGDGYAEPYVATVEEGSGKLRRLVARFLPEDVKWSREEKPVVQSITPTPIYTKYELIPAPDGGFYGLGFGRLLGPINDSANSILNQLLDAGTMSNYGGGFLGRGARFRGGQYTFKPQEWKQVDSPGDDLRKNIVPLMVREPSNILLQLLTYLIGYGERIASANDLQMGENIGQNTPAETARTMNQNGARVFAAIYKRQWRAQRDEFRVRYSLTKIYFEADVDFENLTTGEGSMVSLADYEGPATDVRPAADPTMIDNEQKIAAAELTMGLAFKVPGFNRYLCVRDVLEARRIEDIDAKFPPPPAPEGAPEGTVGDLPSPPDPKMLEIQIKQGKLQLEQQEFQASQMQAAAEMQQDVIELQTDIQLKQAQIYELQAKATKALAEAKGVETGHMVGILQTQMAGLEAQIRVMELQAQKAKGRVDVILGAMKVQEKAGDVQHKRTIQQAQRRDAGAVGGVAAVPGDGGILGQLGSLDPANGTGMVQ